MQLLYVIFTFFLCLYYFYYHHYIGCHQCECNGHGIKEKGECDMETGICFCQDNTEGDHCERCKPNYYGNPRNGRQCYYQCESRGMLDGLFGQGISSRQAYKSPRLDTPTRECLWIIQPAVENQSVIIQLQVRTGFIVVGHKINNFIG